MAMFLRKVLMNFTNGAKKDKQFHWPWYRLPHLLSDGRMMVTNRGGKFCVYDGDKVYRRKGDYACEIRTKEDHEEWVRMLDRFSCYALLKELWGIVNEYL
jgi:hypothetical protein